MAENDLTDGAETPHLVYSLRIGPRARRDIDQAVARFAEMVDEDTALAWERSLYTTIRSLAIQPDRYPMVDNLGFRHGVRYRLFRRTANSIAYRLYFRVQDAGEDGPTVSVLHVRHSSSRPITRKEAREIEAQNP